MLAAHADWSVDPRKRWMALARPQGGGVRLSVEPVGDVRSLFARLRHIAAGAPVVLGVDFPLGLPRAYAARHSGGAPNFPAFLARLAEHAEFFAVAETLDQVAPGRPFYPRRGRRGMSRLSHALALGLVDAAALGRACDQATPLRPAGSPLFWTLGANQSGKAAIAAWRDLLIPALRQGSPPALWPFHGPLLSLAAHHSLVIAETYPAEAMRQLGIRPIGSKRRQADRLAMAPELQAAMASLSAQPDPALAGSIETGFGADAAGEDRFDCLLGVLCVLGTLAGRRPDHAPPDPWIRRWEGWVLGQHA